MLTRNEKITIKNITTTTTKIDATAATRMYEACFSAAERADISSKLLGELNTLWAIRNQNYIYASNNHIDMGGSKPANTASTGRSYSYYYDMSAPVSKIKVRKIKSIVEIQKEVAKRMKEQFCSDVEVQINVTGSRNSGGYGSIMNTVPYTVHLNLIGMRQPTLEELATKKQQARSWKKWIKTRKDELTTAYDTLEAFAGPDE